MPRIKHIDIAKGIGIALVVAGHTDAPPSLIRVIYSFHMPLFFVLAGFTFDHEKYSGRFRLFMAKKARRLLVPYFTACALFYAFWYFIDRNWFSTDTAAVPYTKPLLGILYGNGFGDWLIFNPLLWFFVALFSAEALFFLVMELAHEKGVAAQSAVVAALCAAGVLISGHVRLPWGLDIAMVAQVFMFAGYRLKTSGWLEGKAARSLLLPAACIAVLAASIYVNPKVDMNHRAYRDAAFYLAGSVAGSLLVLRISGWVEGSGTPADALAFLGRNSMAVLLFQFLSFKLVFGFGARVLHPMGFNFLQTRVWPMYVIGGLAVPLAMGWAAGRVGILDRMLLGNPAGVPESLPVMT